MATDRPTVVVVGAGLAGLTCAYRLVDRTINVVLLEAQDRAGGRCWSATGWHDGQIAEHGGEHIEVGQDSILRLVQQLGLELEDRASESGAGSMRLGGKKVAPSEVHGLPSVLKQLAADLDDVGALRFDVASPAARAKDEMSIADWIEESIDGGRTGTLGRAVEAAAVLNLGFDATESSALTLHNMFVGVRDASEDDHGFTFGHGDNERLPELHETVRAAMTEVKHVRGGNDSIVKGLVERLPDGVLRMQSPLTRLSRRTDGRYEVEIADDPRTLIADQVVLAVPLPCLRMVDLEESALSPRRHSAIAELPMGQGTKLLLQLDKRPERIDAWPGFAVTDQPYVAFWDTSAGQPGDAGLLTLFTSGSVFGGNQPHAAATEEVLREATQLLRESLPGMEQHVTSNGWLDNWLDDPWSQGSYAGFAPGQLTRYFGFLHLPEQGVHFAGEHTSMGSQGYLDGAIESGDRAAREVLSAVSS